MMYEIKMPVEIYRGDELIASGELLPNGAELALTFENCGDKEVELFNYPIDTKSVEEKIPMTFVCEGEEVAKGELVQSGSNICLCPDADTSFSIMDPKSKASLYLQSDGWSARLEISRSH
ncbi:MAG TPA: hypothetical protein V6C81_10115 [Planktothrix sp.]|jgi:hypothetical protein